MRAGCTRGGLPHRPPLCQGSAHTSPEPGPPCGSLPSGGAGQQLHAVRHIADEAVQECLLLGLVLKRPKAACMQRALLIGACGMC